MESALVRNRRLQNDDGFVIRAGIVPIILQSWKRSRWPGPGRCWISIHTPRLRFSSPSSDFLSTIIWLLNDLINHTYISFWWLSAIPKRKDWYDDEAKTLGIGRWWSGRLGVKYSHLMHVIPIIFCAAWLWMLALFIPSPRSCYVLAMVGGLALTWGLLAILKKVSELIEKAHASAK